MEQDDAEPKCQCVYVCLLQPPMTSQTDGGCLILLTAAATATAAVC